MRALFVTDLHGSSLVFEKALSAAKLFEVDLLMIGGDLSGKQLLAVIPDGQGSYTVAEPYIRPGEEAAPADDLAAMRSIPRDELSFYLRRLEAKGYYWHIAERDEVAELNGSPGKILRICNAKIYERLMRWAERTNDSLAEGVRCLWTGGNDDEAELMARLATESLGKFEYGEERLIEVDEFEIASLGFSNITPFHTSRELSEDDLSERLQKLVVQARSSETLILNVHVPPLACGRLDLCINPLNPRELVHAGSHAVRACIEKFQPIADFAGHIHEGTGSAMIGRTRIFNPGSEYNAGILQGYVVSFAKSKIIDFAHFAR